MSPVKLTLSHNIAQLKLRGENDASFESHLDIELDIQDLKEDDVSAESETAARTDIGQSISLQAPRLGSAFQASLITRLNNFVSV